MEGRLRKAFIAFSLRFVENFLKARQLLVEVVTRDVDEFLSLRNCLFVRDGGGWEKFEFSRYLLAMKFV